MRALALFAAALVALVAPPAGAEDRFLHLGAKAVAMGGAFTAVANDSTAFHWNPAGYAFGSFLRAGFQTGESEMDRGDLVGSLGDAGDFGRLFVDHATAFSLGFTFLAVSGTSSSRTHAVREGDVLDSRALDTFDLSVSILQSLPIDDLVVAANLHYLDGEAFESTLLASEIAGSSADEIHDLARLGNGVDTNTGTLDVAALYQPGGDDRIRVGFMWRRLVEPRFRLESGEEIVLPRHARAGVAWNLPRSTTVAFDFDLSAQGTEDDDWREISLGASKGFLGDALSLRAGVRAELGGESGARPGFSFGAGGRIAFLLFETAYAGSSGGDDESFWLGVTVAR